jgi:hypothetical protein
MTFIALTYTSPANPSSVRISGYVIEIEVVTFDGFNRRPDLLPGKFIAAAVNRSKGGT